MGKSKKRKRRESEGGGGTGESEGELFRRPEGSPLRKRRKKEKKKKRKREDRSSDEEATRAETSLSSLSRVDLETTEEDLENVPTSPSSSIPSLDLSAPLPPSTPTGTPSLFSDLTSNVTRVKGLPQSLRLNSPTTELWLVRKPRGMGCTDLQGSLATALGGKEALRPETDLGAHQIGATDFRLNLSLASPPSQSLHLLRPVESEEEVLLSLGPRLKGVVTLLPQPPTEAAVSEESPPSDPKLRIQPIDVRRYPVVFDASLLHQRFRPFGLPSKEKKRRKEKKEEAATEKKKKKKKKEKRRRRSSESGE